VIVSVFNGVVENQPFVSQAQRDGRGRLCFQNNVGQYAPAIVYYASGFGFERCFERIRNFTNAAVGVAVAVVDGLNAPPAGDVIFGRGNFQLGIERQFAGGLHQSFAVGSLPDQHAPVVILNHARHNLGCRCAVTVGENDNRNFQVQWWIQGGVRFVPLGHFALRRHHLRIFRDKRVADVDGHVEQPTGVFANVEHEFFHAFALQFLKRRTNFARGRSREIFKVNVADFVRDHAVIRHVGHLHHVADNVQLNGGLLTITLYGQFHGCVVLTLQQFTRVDRAAIAVFAGFQVNAVYFQNLVADAQARLFGGGAFVNHQHDAFSLPLPDECANTVVAAGGHGHVVLDFVFGEEVRVGIEGFQHPVDAGFDHPVGVYLIDVVQIQFFEQRRVDIEVTGNLEEAVVVLEREKADAARHKDRRSKKCETFGKAHGSNAGGNPLLNKTAGFHRIGGPSALHFLQR